MQLTIIMPQVFCAVKALILRGDRFLVIKQNLGEGYGSVWDLPGGRMDYGESPYDTLRREIQEEVCLEVGEFMPVGVWWFFRKHDKNQVVCSTFICEAKDGKVDLNQNPASESIEKFSWVTKEEFLERDYPVSHESLKKLVAGLDFWGNYGKSPNVSL